MRNEAGIRAFGAHLQRLREARGWSREVLADTANVSRMTIYRVELAQHIISLDVLLALAHALEIPPKELLDFPFPTK